MALPSSFHTLLTSLEGAARDQVLHPDHVHGAAPKAKTTAGVANVVAAAKKGFSDACAWYDCCFRMYL